MQQSKKNILLITPNFEKGRCGVSDYADKLAGCIYENDSNLDIYIAALYDKYLKDSFIQNQYLIRIGASVNLSQRLLYFQQFINKVYPQIVIINFVTFGFAEKGMPFWFRKIKQHIPSYSTVHFIFHELWLGSFKTEKLKVKLLGLVQKKIILQLIKTFKPQSCIVTTVISKNVLANCNIHSYCIPVFSNILPKEITNDKGFPIFSASNFIIVGFGNSNFPVDIQGIKDWLYTFIQEKKVVTFYFIGTDHRIVKTFRNFSQVFPQFIQCYEYSNLSEQAVSQILRKADYGLTGYMPEFWSKSGAIAAMLSHRLSVISFAKEENLGVLIEGTKIPAEIQLIHCSNPLYKKNSIEINSDYNQQLFEKINQIIQLL